MGAQGRLSCRFFAWISVVWLIGCSGSHGSAPGAADSSSAARETPRIERIPQVDLSALTDAERSLWVDMVNDQLSPCGEPVSVAKCATEQRTCGACVTGARYMARLVM